MLAISGTADQLEIRRSSAKLDRAIERAQANQRAHVGASRPAHEADVDADADADAPHAPAPKPDAPAAHKIAQAKAALVGMGWSAVIANAAITAAAAVLGDVELERLIFEALRNCPRPRMAA